MRLLWILLLAGCATTSGSKYWDQFGPDQVNCPRSSGGQKVMKVCRQYGPYLICQCSVGRMT